MGCNKIAEAEAAVSVNEEKWLVMYVQLRLDDCRLVASGFGGNGSSGRS
jgi:hypothetical protein